MTDRQLLQHFGRALVATLSVTLLVVTGIAYGETGQPEPIRSVDVRNAR